MLFDDARQYLPEIHTDPTYLNGLLLAALDALSFGMCDDTADIIAAVRESASAVEECIAMPEQMRKHLAQILRGFGNGAICVPHARGIISVCQRRLMLTLPDLNAYLAAGREGGVTVRLVGLPKDLWTNCAF